MSRKTLIGLVSVLLCSHPAVAQEVEISLRELGTLGGDESRAHAVNDLGAVAGASEVEPDSWLLHAFYWSPGTGMVDLGTLGLAWSQALDVNNDGLVVGYASDAYSTRSLVWSPDTGFIDVGDLGGAFSLARAVNDLGQVVGASTTEPGKGQAYRWSAAEGMRGLGTIQAGTASQAVAINELGQVAGWGTTDGPYGQHAFFWSEELGIQDLGTLGGDYSFPWGMNNLGHVVGRSRTSSGQLHAFFWSLETGMVDLGTLGGATSWAFAVNDQGQVVGKADDADGRQRAFLWTLEGGMVDLGSLTGSTFVHGEDINQSGAVIGNSGLLAWMWTAETGMLHLPGVPDGYYTVADEISESFHVAGWCAHGTGSERKFQACRWHVRLDPLTPPEQIGELIQDFEELIADGTLTAGQATGCIAKLEAALRLLDQGNPAAAIRLLEALVFQIQAYVEAGLLFPWEADPLIQQVTELIQELATG